MARSNGKVVSGLGILLLVAAAIGYFNYFGGNSSDLGGSLSFVEGDVDVYGGSGWGEAEEGDDVDAGTKLRTKDGKAIINFDDGSALRLDEYTEVEIITLTSDNIAIENKNGRVYSRVDSASELTWDVIALDATATALGTAYTVEVDSADKEVDVDVLESEVEVDIEKDGDSLTEEVNEGSGLDIDFKKDLDDATSFHGLSLEDATSDDFLVWNATEDAKMDFDLGAFEGLATGEHFIPETEDPKEEDEDKEDEEDEEVDEEKEEGDFVGISLAGSTTDSGVYLKWSVEGVDHENGFKVVKSSSENPTYPGSTSHYLSDAETRSFTWDLKDGETYHFRVCTYDGDGACDVYSNDVAVKAAGEEEEKEEETETEGGYIGLSGEATDNGVSFTWALSEGLTAEKGFKLVKSTSANPVYPGDSATYLSGSDTRAYTLKIEDGKTYHFRVCIYTGDGCSVYSNDVTVTAPKNEKSNEVSIVTGQLALTATSVDAGVKLAWSQAITEDFKYYKVVRSETNANPTYPADGYITYISGQASTTYKDTSGKNGTSYYYRICSVENSGAVSCGNVASVTY